ncbi:MAG: hypothetical protein IKU61_03275 [Clostridia bacterium]|nr:hypothetical protein [Clostridia bacterium]
MEENKNQEMSVDELLAMLKASLEEDGEKTSEKKEETKEAETADEAIEEETVAFEEPSGEEETSAAPVEETKTIQEEEKTEPSKINEADIFAAWGISAADIEQQSDESVEEGAEEISEPSEAKTFTKAYYVTRVEKKDEFRTRKATENQRNTTDYGRTDCSLIKQALGMEKVTENVDAQEFFTVENDKEEIPVDTIDQPRDEFTYQRQSEDIMADYKRGSRGSLLKLIASAVIAVLLFLVECLPAFGVASPSILNPEYYPVVYAMVTLQLVWLAGAFSYREIANGFLALRRFRITAGGVLGLLLLFGTACTVATCALGMKAALFGFATAFSALLVRAFDFMDIRREVFAFEVASSTQSKKRVMVAADHGQINKIMGLEDYSGEDSLVLRTEKCSFVENYFSRTEKRSYSENASNRYLVPVVLAVAAAVAIICGVNGGASAGIGAFNGCISVGLPMLILLSSSYPLYIAGAKLSHIDSAIIGEASVEEYSGTTMICFDDADAFPSYGVALENLRIYGKGDIETIIEQMDAVFSKLGGPLRSVFALMISECPKPYRVKIDGVYDDGVKATVDGSELYIGSAAFMEKNGFVVTDKTRESGGKIFSTMYLAENGALRAKFFIRYTLDGSFEAIVKKLARRGIASVILTGDSNINDELLAQFIDISKLPVKVVRRSVDDAPLHNDRADSGIVSVGGVRDLVSTVTMCDRLAGIIGTMRAVRIASTVICALVVLAVALLNMAGLASSLHVLIYHLFWMIPAWLVTRFNIG